MESWNTMVVARWVARCTLLNGDPHENHGVHFNSIKWGKAYEFDVYEDTQVVRSLATQARFGIREAIAMKLES